MRYASGYIIEIYSRILKLVHFFNTQLFLISSILESKNPSEATSEHIHRCPRGSIPPGCMAPKNIYVSFPS